ncbi:MAG TPA: OmpA family protein [Candidatus Kapabacteria bacterium]|nr:OmpA family protein [Candidatus Kapabacteria bacterium]
MVQIADKLKEDIQRSENNRNYYRLQSQAFKNPSAIKEAYNLNISKDSIKLLLAEGRFPFRNEINKINSDSFPNTIEIHYTIFDTLGKNLGGLAPPYFNGTYDYKKHWLSLIDSCDGNKYDVRNFEVEEVRDNKKSPFSIMFVLDHSPSMGNSKALKLQQAIHKILYAIKQNDIIGVVKFTRDIYYEVELTNNQDKYRKDFKMDSLDSQKYTNGTAMYDALNFSINKLSEINDKSKKIIILFSDGGDNSSKINFDSVLVSAKKNNISVYGIAYGIADTNMELVSKFTGGKFYQILSSNEFLYVFKDIYTLLNNYYLITYKPINCPSKHFVTVNLDLLLQDFGQVMANGIYDKSLFKEYDLPGTTLFFNIEFDFASYTIKEPSMKIIEDVAKSLKNNPNLKIKVKGHTDDIGDEEVNLELSKERALSVKKALIQLGIDNNRIISEGYGESKPMLPNTNDDNRKRNRRIEFEIIK